MNITLKQFNNLLDAVNHRLTKLESDMKWVKYIGYYMATLITGLIIRSFI